MGVSTGSGLPEFLAHCWHGQRVLIDAETLLPLCQGFPKCLIRCSS